MFEITRDSLRPLNLPGHYITCPQVATLWANPDVARAAALAVRIDVDYPFVPYIPLPFNPTLHTAADGRIIFNRS